MDSPRAVELNSLRVQILLMSQRLVSPGQQVSRWIANSSVRATICTIRCDSAHTGYDWGARSPVVGVRG